MEAARTMLDLSYFNLTKDEDRTKIPPKSFWNIKKAKQDNIYFYLKEIKAVKVTKQQAEGRGQRLGIAYRLEDGTMVYVPE